MQKREIFCSKSVNKTQEELILLQWLFAAFLANVLGKNGYYKAEWISQVYMFCFMDF